MRKKVTVVWKFKSILSIIGICILLGSGVVGCRNENTLEMLDTKGNAVEERTIQTQPSNDERIKVGVSYQNLQNEFIQNIQEALSAKAKELDIELIEADGQGKSEYQISHVESFIVRKVDVIILNPCSVEGCKLAVQSANKAGIPILTVNNIVANQDMCETYVGSDSEESGRIQMEYVAKKLQGKGNIVILRGPIGHDAEIGRRKGAQEILEKYPGIKVLFEQSANWSRDEAKAIMEVWLQSGQHIDAVVAQNDEMALGALKAVEEVDKLNDILIFGVDAIPDALDAINGGRMEATVFQDAKGQGIKAIEAAFRIAKGLQVEKTIYIPYDLVTRDDVYKYIDLDYSRR